MLNAQIPNEQIATFPVHFVSELMSQAAPKSSMRATSMYPDLLTCRMMVFPVMSHQRLSIVTVMNPIAAIDSQFKSRGIPAILFLQPCQSGADHTKVFNRIRLLLNRIRQSDSKYMSSQKFNYRNLPVKTPTGEIAPYNNIS